MTDSPMAIFAVGAPRRDVGRVRVRGHAGRAGQLAVAAVDADHGL